MPSIRFALCQVNAVVGDLTLNTSKIIDALGVAEAAGCDLAVFPEMVVTGYPPEDLLLKPGFITDNLTALQQVAAATGSCAAAVGFVDRDSSRPELGQEPSARPRLFNAAALCSAGLVRGVYHKRLLPNYGVFDEERYFVQGHGPQQLFEVASRRIALSICEDAWLASGPLAQQAAAGAELLVNLSASPYSAGRIGARTSTLRERALECSIPVVYVNLVGGQDELVFDGGSMVIDATGEVLARLGQFAEAVSVIDIDLGAAGTASMASSGASGRESTSTSTSTRRSAITSGSSTGPEVELIVVAETPARAGGERAGGTHPPDLAPMLELEDEIYAALVLGTRDYVTKNGFTEVVIGLSGGIDSSLVAVLAADALGPSHVHGVAMPSRYSSEGSLSDAQDLAKRTGIELFTIPIEPAHAVLMDMISPSAGLQVQGLPEENLQSRIRGIILMALSNAHGWLVLSTGNKSEMATGYSTLYGDAVGAFAPIKDVPKTLVYSLARARNTRGSPRGSRTPGRDGARDPIPEDVLSKPPSAELRPDQRDDQSLPPYDVLDPVLEGYVEDDMTTSDLVESGFGPRLVAQVTRLVDQAEYKRRQMPPGVRITQKAFGKDRRMPMTNGYRGEIADFDKEGTT